MKRVLLINLKKLGDVFSMGHLVGSIKKTYPQSEISLLVYRESEPAASCLKNIKSIYQIDRKKILSLKSSPLFSDAFAFNEFISLLQEVKAAKWGHVINVSNDPISTLLTSYLTEDKYSGICLEKDKSTNYSNYWAKVYNDILPGAINPGISYIENIHQMAEVEMATGGEKAHTLPSINEMFAHKISQIRKQRKHLSFDSKLVGVQIKSSSLSKDIPLDVLCGFLISCLKIGPFHPIILISPSQEERELANHINSIVSNDLDIIETDFKALPSLLLHLDILVTPDTSVKHMGDLMDTPVVEASLGESPLFKQSSVSEGSIIIRPRSERGPSINAMDLLKACFALSDIDDTHLNYSEDVMVYRAFYKQGRLEYLSISDHFDADRELGRLVAKDLLYFYGGQEKSLLFNKYYKKMFREDEVKIWVEKEKSVLLAASKQLLNCLRSINQIKVQNFQGKNFVADLKELLEFCNKQTVISIPLSLFRASVESIRDHGPKENVAMVEEYLFSLKNDLRKFQQFITKHVEGPRRASQKELRL